VAKIRPDEPKQFDRLEFVPSEEAQVDYGEGVPVKMTCDLSPKAVDCI